MHLEFDITFRKSRSAAGLTPQGQLTAVHTPPRLTLKFPPKQQAPRPCPPCCPRGPAPWCQLTEMLPNPSLASTRTVRCALFASDLGPPRSTEHQNRTPGAGHSRSSFRPLTPSCPCRRHTSEFAFQPELSWVFAIGGPHLSGSCWSPCPHTVARANPHRWPLLLHRPGGPPLGDRVLEGLGRRLIPLERSTRAPCWARI